MPTREKVLSERTRDEAASWDTGILRNGVAAVVLREKADEITALELALSAKQAALGKYGEHLVICPAHYQYNNDSAVCTCGFAEAMGEK